MNFSCIGTAAALLRSWLLLFDKMLAMSSRYRASLLVFAFPLLAPLVGAASARAPAGDPVDAYVRAQMREQQIPGLADGYELVDGKIRNQEWVARMWSPVELENGETEDYGFGWAFGS